MLGSTASTDSASIPLQQQKRELSNLAPEQLRSAELAGEPIERVLNRAPGNDGAIGGMKVVAKSGWFAARASGTENIYEIYAEGFLGEERLRAVLHEAQAIVDTALARIRPLHHAEENNIAHGTGRGGGPRKTSERRRRRPRLALQRRLIASIGSRGLGWSGSNRCEPERALAVKVKELIFPMLVLSRMRSRGHILASTN